MKKLLRSLFVLPIRFYQRVISPLTPPSCRFRPTCSEYGAQAILAHGPLKGVLLAIWRVLRCHPFHDGGLDPVPAQGRWKAEPLPPSPRDEEDSEPCPPMESPQPSARPPGPGSQVGSSGRGH